MGETMLRVANIEDEVALESVRDALDALDIVYEHIRSEPDEDTFPQIAYFYAPITSRTTWITSCSGSPKSTASRPRCYDA